MVWDDPDTGLRCKGRPDLVVTDLQPRHESADQELIAGPLVVDLKLTQDNSPRGFQKTLARFRYHWQAAMYLDGLCLSGQWQFGQVPFVFLAVKNTPVYTSEIYVLDRFAIDQGRKEYRRALRLLAECKRTNTWPTNSGRVQTIGLPPWALEV